METVAIAALTFIVCCFVLREIIIRGEKNKKEENNEEK